MQWGLRLEFWGSVPEPAALWGTRVQSLSLGAVLPPCLAYTSCSRTFFCCFLGVCCLDLETAGEETRRFLMFVVYVSFFF